MLQKSSSEGTFTNRLGAPNREVCVLRTFTHSERSKLMKKSEGRRKYDSECEEADDAVGRGSAGPSQPHCPCPEKVKDKGRDKETKTRRKEKEKCRKKNEKERKKEEKRAEKCRKRREKECKQCPENCDDIEITRDSCAPKEKKEKERKRTYSDDDECSSKAKCECVAKPSKASHKSARGTEKKNKRELRLKCIEVGSTIDSLTVSSRSARSKSTCTSKRSDSESHSKRKKWERAEASVSLIQKDPSIEEHEIKEAKRRERRERERREKRERERRELEKLRRKLKHRKKCEEKKPIAKKYIVCVPESRCSSSHSRHKCEKKKKEVCKLVCDPCTDIPKKPKKVKKVCKRYKCSHIESQRPAKGIYFDPSSEDPRSEIKPSPNDCNDPVVEKLIECIPKKKCCLSVSTEICAPTDCTRYTSGILCSCRSAKKNTHKEIDDNCRKEERRILDLLSPSIDSDEGSIKEYKGWGIVEAPPLHEYGRSRRDQDHSMGHHSDAYSPHLSRREMGWEDFQRRRRGAVMDESGGNQRPPNYYSSHRRVEDGAHKPDPFYPDTHESQLLKSDYERSHRDPVRHSPFMTGPREERNPRMDDYQRHSRRVNRSDSLPRNGHMHGGRNDMNMDNNRGHHSGMNMDNVGLRNGSFSARRSDGARTIEPVKAWGHHIDTQTSNASGSASRKQDFQRQRRGAITIDNGFQTVEGNQTTHVDGNRRNTDEYHTPRYNTADDAVQHGPFNHENQHTKTSYDRQKEAITDDGEARSPFRQGGHEEKNVKPDTNRKHDRDVSRTGNLMVDSSITKKTEVRHSQHRDETQEEGFFSFLEKVDSDDIRILYQLRKGTDITQGQSCTNNCCCSKRKRPKKDKSFLTQLCNTLLPKPELCRTCGKPVPEPRHQSKNHQSVCYPKKRPCRCYKRCPQHGGFTGALRRGGARWQNRARCIVTRILTHLRICK